VCESGFFVCAPEIINKSPAAAVLLVDLWRRARASVNNFQSAAKETDDAHGCDRLFFLPFDVVLCMRWQKFICPLKSEQTLLKDVKWSSAIKN
jgi:hypothetical protein